MTHYGINQKWQPALLGINVGLTIEPLAQPTARVVYGIETVKVL